MDLLVDTMRVRGAGAARLARVAASTLPAALERALEGLPGGRVDTLTVAFVVEPDSVDDETLAILWADAIRAELARSLGTTASTEPDAVATAHKRHVGWVVTRESAAATARAVVARPGAARAVPPEALEFGVILERAATAGGDISGQEARLVVELAERLRPSTAGEAAATEQRALGTPGNHATPPFANPATAHGERGAAVAPASGSDTEAAPVQHNSPERRLALEAAARVAAIAELNAATPADARPQSLDCANLTDAAGLALLYPWLADLCRSAVDLHPGLDPAAVRAQALAALVDPERPLLVNDPLVTLLAGDTARDGEPAELPRAAEVRAAADAVLGSFASLLPGFAGSSAEFVRREWVQRLGLVDPSLDPIRLTAHSHPLDVVLPQLPYPLGLFRLPWSPPVMVRFRP